MTILNESYELPNGVSIPKIALGTWQVPRGEVVHPTEFALKNGYKHIDTAHSYENAKGVGEGIKASGVDRNEIFITSKVRGESKTYERAAADIDDQLNDLNTDYIDLMLIHAPTPWAEFSRTDKNRTSHYYDENVAVWRALIDACEDKKVRAIGVSNFNVDDLKYLIAETDVKPAINQIKYHIGYTQPEIVEFCKENGILVEAYSSLGTGKLLDNPDIKKIADKYGKSIPQIALRYPLQKGLVILPKSVHEEYILDNAELDFEIEQSDMEYLDNLTI